MNDYVIGIDGGGSSVRAVVTDRNFRVIGSATAGSANPNSAGRDAAATAIQSVIRAALDDAKLPARSIAAVGAGIAGTLTAREWVEQTIALVLPHARMVAVSDFEIALVGANGERRGVLILSGTGSVAFGINAAGETAQVGGWGYLLGDEGSGYWIGLQALQAVVQAADGRGDATALTDAILRALDLASPRDLIQWIYAPSRIREAAALAPLVLAATDDAVAREIVARGVEELASLAQTVIRRLQIESPSYAFAGRLLSEANPLSVGVCAALGLDSLPVPKHPPVIGAAILALSASQT